jgi:hypothetical protein
MLTKFWSENLKGRDNSGRPRSRWQDNKRMHLREIVWEDVDWMLWLRTGTGSQKARNFLSS